MNMKIQKILLVLISMIVLTSCSSSENLVAPEKVSKNASDSFISITPNAVQQDVLLKTENNITVEITSTKVISTGLEIGVCYTTPDNGEWRPMPGHLFYGEYEVFPDEIEFLEEEILADEENTGTRCALIRYRIEDLNTLATPVKFSILQIYAPSREMYTPCQELQTRLDTNSRAITYGLKASCVETGDGNVSITLVSYNPSLAKDEAMKRLDEIAKAEVVGPWEFGINEIER